MARPSNNQQSASPTTGGALESTDRSKEQLVGTGGGEGANAEKEAESGALQQAATPNGEGAVQGDLNAEGEGATNEDGAEGEPQPPPVVSRHHDRGVISAVVAKGRTVQDVDGVNRKAGQSVRVPVADHERLLDLGFLAKPERQIVVPSPKKGPSITRGS
ncbi:hypothetical protein [Luteibacter yeojuensis]|uniref:Uncharacterized protein n=1 Tax=Luteibacter yeojuensis TaxID=345309 RepID=A0A7X5QU04_9GAMM|nr:hypothetical protein [Luteibacter yeojuensis]NID15386.1 hypothetical protein [Luteibacter yeojuensis]